MKYEFQVKQIKVPLFGVVEVANTDPWFTAFSSAYTATQVVLNDQAFEMIARDLGMDADSMGYNMARYVHGKYLPGTTGLGGSTLGDIGELLTFVTQRALGKTIVRVVSGTREGREDGIENRFPQPDFIVSETGKCLAALEVKSTQALDHLDLSGKHDWRLLQPCASVKVCRAEALPQLAIINGVAQKQSHQLRLREGKTVPFPVGKGVAVAVAAVDGRVNTLRNDVRLKTPQPCRTAKRDCWTCLPSSGCHFVMTIMENAPGRLSLPGTPNEGQGTAWITAYQRWGEAVHARDRNAAAVMTDRLSVEVANWIDTMNLGKDVVAPLQTFWKSHLTSAMSFRGIEFGPDLVTEVPASDNGDAMEKISSLLARRPGGAQPFIRWFNTTPAKHQQASFTITQDDRSSELRMMSPHWWALENSGHAEENARSSVAYMLTIATGIGFLDGDLSLLPLEPVVASVGMFQLKLGWCWDSSITGRRNAWTLLSQLGVRSHWRRPVWLARMIYGDPRVTLSVTENGRAVLRIENSVFD